MDTPGVRLVRRLRWMGCEDHVAPIGELAFENVRVPRANLLGAEGEGFGVTQVRLGPRIHHCMRSIGLCELLIELMMVRSSERSAFGRTVMRSMTPCSAGSRNPASSSNRRGCWRTAARGGSSQAGHHGAWRDVSLIKVAVPAMLQRIADRAMQVFGARWAAPATRRSIKRLARAACCELATVPMKCYLRRIYRMEPVPSWSIADSPYLSAHPS